MDALILIPATSRILRRQGVSATGVAFFAFLRYTFTMVSYDDMTPEERDRLIYLVLREIDLKAIVLIMKQRFGPDVTTDQIMRFAFKVAVGRMTPAHLKKKRASDIRPQVSAKPGRDAPPDLH